MSGYILSPQALEDSFHIWRFLAIESSTQFANQIEAELFEVFEALALNPGLGHKREDLTKIPVFFHRAFPHQYLIVYRRPSPVEIVAVLHAKRNIKRILRARQ